MFDLYDRAASKLTLSIIVAMEISAAELAIGHVVVALAAVGVGHIRFHFRAMGRLTFAPFC